MYDARRWEFTDVNDRAWILIAAQQIVYYDTLFFKDGKETNNKRNMQAAIFY